MKVIKVIVILLILAGCQREAQQEVQSTNNNFKVQLLFEVDRCKVYRFYDGGVRYFTTCKGNVSWDEKNGKGSKVEDYTIETK
jgi:hypothetical protein